MTGPDHLAAIHHLRQLAGNARPTDALIADMLVAARRLESLVAQWQAFPPRPRTLQDAENAIEGLSRSLADLRMRAAQSIAEARDEQRDHG
jgi:hypothetical protein